MAITTDPQKTGISSNESYASFASFPPVGRRGLFYIDLATNDAYLWDGSLYELSGGGGGGGVTDHGALTGLSDDDHPQYHNDTRGDARYYTKSEVDTSLAGKLNTPTSPVSFWSQMPTFPNQLNYFTKEYDFFPNVVATNFAGDIICSSSGTGAAYQLADKSTALAGINSTEKANGVVYLNLGTAAVTRAHLGFGTNGVASFSFGSHEMIWGSRTNIATLSDATNTFTAYNGFMESVTAAPAQGAFFRYTHSVNGGRWEYCIANGSITAADTGVAPSAGVYQVFEIKANTAGTTISYYIDGALVGTVTVGIPTAGIFPAINLIRSAGTSGSYGSYVDAMYLAIERLAVR